MANELPIPPAANASPAIEMIRVWLANGQLHTVLNIGFWEDRGLDERSAWGVLLADVVRHVADAHESEYGHAPSESIARIRQAFEAEMGHPTSERLGQFIKERRGQEP
ncbi:DUF5076 domain-containing protein [Singulisphaera sp. PoT]|uniref:DUF5076 domain-containing protein n=1 Tax=Singulisphaera sp. PoT TaxID=3411797 RepID=UPI003BF52C70